MSRDDLETRFAQTLIEGGFLARDESVVAAVSGGADSVAMLHLLCALNESHDWSLQIQVAHLNHQLRGQDADEDAEFVRSLCGSLRVPCTIETMDVMQRANSDGVSVEQAARSCRFEFFERLCLRMGQKAVFLAHHADDNVETVFHRILRGTGLRGLGGIRPVRPIRGRSDIRIVRPMLGFWRSEIEDYLHRRGISHRYDQSNESDDYTRNRIRCEVLPLIRDRINPQAAEAVLRLAAQARCLDAYLTETAERVLEALIVDRDDRVLILHCPSLMRRPRVIQTELIRHALVRMGVGEGQLTFEHLNRVVDLASESSGSKRIALPGDVQVHREYTRLIIEGYASPRSQPLRDVQVHVGTEGSTLLPEVGLELVIERLAANRANVTDHLHRMTRRGQVSQEEWIDADRVHPPLIARAWRPGDRFFPLGMSGMKKLSDFFIDDKIPSEQRERTVLLCDQLGPIWVVPFRIDERVRLTEATRHVLRLQVRSIESH